MIKMEEISISNLPSGNMTQIELNNGNKKENELPTKTTLSASNKSSTPAVIIRDAWKRYSATNVILKGLNLTVQEGAIYGLLGPSGCGKTTLLSCIVGRIHLDCGSIQLKVKRRTEVGYMPQDLTLHEQLTIFETFNFYGLTFGMTKDQIKKRAIEMIEFLDLPSGHRFLKTLSGGQQRRVSVAVSLLHDPTLLILDEPTVGLDPVLSQSIWVRLLEMAGQGKSIIITTHYIQEARHAHAIGLMRNGVLLAEESPQDLMNMCNCDDLEEAFLTLSHRQENSNTETKEVPFPTNKPLVKASFTDDQKLFSMMKYRGAMYKNLTLLKREYIFIAFVIILPLMQTFLFNTAIGRKPTGLSVAIVNDEVDHGNCNKTLNDGCFLENAENMTLSCRYLDYLIEKQYKLVDYDDNDIALNDVRKNKVWALIHFPHNYTSALSNRVANGTRATDYDAIFSSMGAWVDLSNQYIGNMVLYDLLLSLEAFINGALVQCDANPKIGAIPLKFETPVFGNVNEDYLSYAATSIVCLCAFFFPTILTAGLILTEKIGGMIERMLVAGITMKEMTAAIVIIQMAVHVLQTALVMIMMYCFFDNPFKGSLTSFSALMILIGIGGMFFGFALAAISNQLSMCAYVGIGFNIFLCFTSGLIWPVEAEHELLKQVSWSFPLTLPANAARAITAKAYKLFHPVVLQGFISMTVWDVIFIIALFLTLKYKKDVWVVKK